MSSGTETASIASRLISASLIRIPGSSHFYLPAIFHSRPSLSSFSFPSLRSSQICNYSCGSHSQYNTAQVRHPRAPTAALFSTISESTTNQTPSHSDSISSWSLSSSSPSASSPYHLISSLPSIISSSSSSTSPSSSPLSSSITIQGWVRSVRISKNVSFIVVSDGSCFHSLQIVLEKEQAKQCSTGTAVRVEGKIVKIENQKQGSTATSLSSSSSSSAAAAADFFSSYELHSSQLTVLGPSDTSYPISKQYLSLEYLRDHLHFRSRTNTISSILRIRHQLTKSVNKFFDENGFILVHTPILTPLDCEGAGETFQAVVKNDQIVAQPETKPDQNPGSRKSVQPTSSTSPVVAPSFSSSAPSPSTSPSTSPSAFRSDFFSRPVYLTVSGQLYAEMLACSLTRVYTFGPTFRAESGITNRHLSEFWMIEPEVAFADLDDVINLAEAMIKYVVKETVEKMEDELRFLDKREKQEWTEAEKEKSIKQKQAKTSASTSTSSAFVSLLTRLSHLSSSHPFARVEYTDAITILQDAEKAGKTQFVFPVQWGDSLQSEHERYLAEVVFQKPVFVRRYPKSIKPFYMKISNSTAPTSSLSSSSPPSSSSSSSSFASTARDTVDCFDLLIPGVGELIGGSAREVNHDRLLQRMNEFGLNVNDYQWYLDLRKYGSVEHAGFGLGFERLLKMITGIQNVRDLIPVPRAPGLAKF